MLVELFHWPLHEIDATDISSLIPFVFHYPHWKGTRGRPDRTRTLFADEADWL